MQVPLTHRLTLSSLFLGNDRTMKVKLRTEFPIMLYMCNKKFNSSVGFVILTPKTVFISSFTVSSPEIA